MKIFAMTLLLGIGMPATAFAAGTQNSDTQANGAPSTKYYDFEDDQVEGDLQRPDGELVSAIHKAEHKSLIEIRHNFIPELVKSFEDL